jgi:predicted kinase
VTTGPQGPDSGRATITLFCGLPGSGKTTLAQRLEAEGRGVRLCTDEWQRALGVPPEDGDFHERLQATLYRHALELLGVGCDVILEDGLWRAEERAAKLRDARERGARIEFHIFDVERDELWSRLQHRNSHLAGAFPMSRKDLDDAWAIFEPPTPAELAMVDVCHRHRGALNEASPGTRRSHMQARPAPTLFLMVGLPGSGKTVQARQLAEDRSALQLTPDAWMISLFGQEDRHQTRPDGKRWLLEGRLVGLAVDVLRLGVSVVLDFGLWSREERSALRWIARSAGASCEVVYLPVERAVQWSRIQARWASAPDRSFPMAEDEIDGWKAAFAVPDAVELSGSSLPAPPPGDESWWDWAQRFWPSLAESENGPPVSRT